MSKHALLSLIIPFLTTSPAFSATLQEAYQSALQKNETVGLQNAKVTQAKERVSQLRGGLYPQISAKATYFMQPEAKDPLAQEIFPDRQTTVALSANQVLFRGLREFAGIRQQKDLLESQEEARNQALLQLYQDVANSYLNILTLEQDLKNLEVQIKLYDERVSELSGRVRRGESNSTEVLTAQSSQAGLKAESQIVSGNLKMARELFAFITGLPANESLTDPALTKNKSINSLDYYLKRIEERYDVKSARELYNAAEEDVKIAKGAHWPSLDVAGNYYLKRPEGFSEDLKWDVQFTLTLPIFEGGTTQAKVREAASRKIEADLTLARLRRQADQEIRAYYENYQSRLNQVAALEKATSLSEKNYQVLQRDYRRGLSRNVDVQIALTDFRVASRALDQARFAAQSELVRLQIAAAEMIAPAVKED
ncbi:transporter [Bdellovibrio bacteriovorus]|uniref:Transporter n=1 Tax=Bdellovibrio bacteriovorus TaxID=959 RepID=A0A150WBE1_BDEBC|nr:TolC family protein [Bdellovibrio bacteriovorus]KYG60344.1 transporter [Bdellovibrio bacteriovorus]